MFVGILKVEVLAHYGSKAGFIRRFGIGNEPLDNVLSGVYRINYEPVVFTVKDISASTVALVGGVVDYGGGSHLEAPLQRVEGKCVVSCRTYNIGECQAFSVTMLHILLIGEHTLMAGTKAVKKEPEQREDAGPSHDPTTEEQDGFDAQLVETQQVEDQVPAESVIAGGKSIVWYPHNGSQVDFLQCPVFECLLHGNRGGGKSDALLFAFAQHVGRGYREAWRGVIFRQTYPALAEMVLKSQKWFRQIYPKATFNRAKMFWEWPTGEQLLFRHVLHPNDYFSYHGFEFPFIGFEELTTWPGPECYLQAFTLCRTARKGVPLMIRSNTNPYGPGHNWVKDRFGLHGKWWETIIIKAPRGRDGNVERPRCAIYSSLDENKKLLEASPEYKQTVATGITNEAMAAAWLDGDWSIVAGGMFSDVWDAKYNVVPRFKIPDTWRLDRSFDWGSASPFSVGWWAESDGSDVEIPGRGWMSTVRGDTYRIHEYYGWTGRPNEGLKMLATDVAREIIERELAWGIHGKVRSGPADSSIYNMENGMSIGVDMAKPVRIGGRMYPGVSWTPADKRPGSRKAGWELMRTMLKSAHPDEVGLPRERPGLFVFDHCAAIFKDSAHHTQGRERHG